MNILRRRALDISLGIVLALSFAAILLGQENPFVRIALCGVAPCPKFAHSHAWEKIAYDVGIASVVSLFFYALIVRIPEHQRKRRLKRSFSKHYEAFKRNCIMVMLGVADLTSPRKKQEELMDENKFYDYFEEQLDSGQKRWDRFAENLKQQQRWFEELIRNLDHLRDEITFVLNNVDIYDEQAFEFLKELSVIVVEMRALKADDKSVPKLCRFLWWMFTGWSFVVGGKIERKPDFVKDMFEAI